MGTGQVAGAVMASGLTTCVVFLPVLFVEGLAARLIEGIAFAVVTSQLASLVVAMVVIPALAKWFLAGRAAKGAVPVGERIPRYRRATEAMVRRLLHVPVLTVLVATAISAVSAWMLLGLGTELLAPSDPRRAVAGTLTGVFASRDGGLSWRRRTRDRERPGERCRPLLRNVPGSRWGPCHGANPCRGAPRRGRQHRAGDAVHLPLGRRCA